VLCERSRSRIVARESEQILILPVVFPDDLPLMVRDELTLRVGLFWLIITNVDRKIASSKTIIVSGPYG
jgi:hypothetical protein